MCKIFLKKVSLQTVFIENIFHICNASKCALNQKETYFIFINNALITLRNNFNIYQNRKQFMNYTYMDFVFKKT